jgi:iron complex transport system ATP-binding protein
MTATVPTVFPVRGFDVGVVAVRRLSPSFLRVTLAGADLRLFDGCGDLGPRDLRVKLMIPSPGHPLPDLTDLTPGWYQQWRGLDPHTRGAMRTYTVRRARLDGPDPEIDLDFVVHGAEAGRPADGPAVSWATAARRGDRLTVIGPAAGARGYGGIEWRPPLAGPGAPVRVLLAGDETAVPAISSVLETLPAAYHGHAVLEVPYPQDFLDVRTGSGVEIRWVARPGRDHGTALRAEVEDLMRRQPVPSAGHQAGLPDIDVDRELLWESTVEDPVDRSPFYAWIAGEAATVRTLRRHLVQDLGIDRRSVAFMGYWRQGKAEVT